jgi:hypothetical protein
MQNSPGIPLVALVVAAALAVITVLSVIAGVGGVVALNELQIGATAWALALGLFGVQGFISIVVEGRQVAPGVIEPRMNNQIGAAVVTLSIALFSLAGITGLAIASNQSPTVIGIAAGSGCFTLGLLLLFYKEAFVGHEAHLDLRHDGVPW